LDTVQLSISTLRAQPGLTDLVTDIPASAIMLLIWIFNQPRPTFRRIIIRDCAFCGFVDLLKRPEAVSVEIGVRLYRCLINVDINLYDLILETVDHWVYTVREELLRQRSYDIAGHVAYEACDSHVGDVVPRSVEQHILHERDRGAHRASGSMR